MTELLANHIAGRWQVGSGPGSRLMDPVLGTELVRVDASGLDLHAAFVNLLDRQRTCVVKTRGPQPFVDADAVHGGVIVAQAGA